MNDTLPDIEPLPPLPKNSAALAAFPAEDRVHTILRIMYNCTHLSDDGQKLLLHMLMNALTELEKAVKAMNRIEVAAKLAQFERIRKFHDHGNGEN